MNEDTQLGEGTAQKPRHHDEDWLREHYVESDNTVRDVAELCNVDESSISTWLRKHGLGDRQREVDLTDVDIPENRPWRQKDLLKTLYIEKGLSPNDISGILDCSATTVRNWLDNHDIETRSMSQAQSNSYGTLNHASYRTKKTGREVWKVSQHTVLVYRLLAVSEWGFDEVSQYDIHHKNGIPWDNRPDNLELVTNENHQRKHRKITGLDRIRIAELYENGDCSSYTVADIVDVDVSPNTVRKIHRECFEDSVA